MGLEFFIDESFTSGSIVDPSDSFTGDGVATTFVLQNKSVQRLSSTIQVEGVQYYQYSGGFTKDIGTNSFTLSSPPPLNSQISAPGITQITVPVFDQNIVPGVSNPRVKEVPIWIGDGSTINNNIYSNLPQYSGIQIAIVDVISSTGAQASWCQFAAAAVNGTALTYGATGAPLYTPPISSFGVLSQNSSAGASSIFCTTASSFTAGDYVYLNIGQANQEVRKINSITSSTGRMDLATALDFSHITGETVITCGRKFWLKVTIPLNAANNQPVNFYDIAISRLGRVISRV